MKYKNSREKINLRCGKFHLFFVHLLKNDLDNMGKIEDEFLKLQEDLLATKPVKQDKPVEKCIHCGGDYKKDEGCPVRVDGWGHEVKQDKPVCEHNTTYRPNQPIGSTTEFEIKLPVNPKRVEPIEKIDHTNVLFQQATDNLLAIKLNELISHLTALEERE